LLFTIKVGVCQKSIKIKLGKKVNYLLMSTQYKSGCKFCPPRNEFAIVAKNDHAIAIICDTAKNWGHSLIIPKNHSSNLASVGMDSTIWKKGMVPLLREIIEKFKKNPQVIGFHINSNAGKSAEQSVFHTHIHVVPVYQKDKDNWTNFFNRDFAGQWAKEINGWDNSYQQIQDHIKDCLSQKILKNDKEDEFGDFPAWDFNLLARIKNGPLDIQEHFLIIPKTSTSVYHWNGGGPYLNFAARERIAQRINNEEWEEENTEKPNIPKKDKPTEEPTENKENQQPNQNGNSGNPAEPEKYKNDNNQVPNEKNENNNKDNNNGQKPSNGDGPNDNNSDRKKNKKTLSPNIPDSVKEYFQKNNVKSVELNGENWIITYKDKKNQKTVPLVNVSELQGLANYLKSKGIKTFNATELETSHNTNSFASKYWPWILGVGGILVIGVIAWVVRKRQRKNK
jgi:histidine triad (HIT) family protein